MKIIFDDIEVMTRRIAEAISETADSVGKKTNEVMEIQKIKNQINTMDREIQRGYKDLGKMVYEQFRNEESVEDSARVMCEDIKKHKEEISKCEQQLSRLRGLYTCKKCGAMLDREMKFCPYCGEEMEPDECYEGEVVGHECSCGSECTCDESCGCGDECSCGEEACNCDEKCECEAEECTCTEEKTDSEETCSGEEKKEDCTE